MQRQTLIGLADLRQSRSSASSKANDASNETECEAHISRRSPGGTGEMGSLCCIYTHPEADRLSFEWNYNVESSATVAAVTAGILENRNTH